VKWLIDNNVPHGVTTLLLDLGHEAVEVRQALADNASDLAVAAYAAAESFVLVTHDRGLARRCLLAGIPHLWLRTPEPQDADRIREVLPAIEEAFAAGSVRVVASRRTLTSGPETRSSPTAPDPGHFT
jgi:predicted nuclease of predicted toxin-antitoxin system